MRTSRPGSGVELLRDVFVGRNVRAAIARRCRAYRSGGPPPIGPPDRIDRERPHLGLDAISANAKGNLGRGSIDNQFGRRRGRERPCGRASRRRSSNFSSSEIPHRRRAWELVHNNTSPMNAGRFGTESASAESLSAASAAERRGRLVTDGGRRGSVEYQTHDSLVGRLAVFRDASTVGINSGDLVWNRSGARLLFLTPSPDRGDGGSATCPTKSSTGKFAESLRCEFPRTQRVFHSRPDSVLSMWRRHVRRHRVYSSDRFCLSEEPSASDRLPNHVFRLIRIGFRSNSGNSSNRPRSINGRALLLKCVSKHIDAICLLRPIVSHVFRNDQDRPRPIE